MLYESKNYEKIAKFIAKLSRPSKNFRIERNFSTKIRY